MYDIVFITNLPAFYKVNLYNEIAKYRSILVVFTHDFDIQRNEDFYEGERNFNFISIAKKSMISKIFFIFRLCNNRNYLQLILVGWDQLILWVSAFRSSINKNSLVVESSILESSTTGFKGLLKRIFCSRISKAYVSGKSQADLINAIGFRGEIIITKGVGIFRVRPSPIFQKVSAIKNFLYVGRLSPEKNLQFLIEIFNQLPGLNLNIVGFGAQEFFLKSIAKENIIFHGAIPNAHLYKIYLQNDVFILPSISEPWGIVVEESLNNGLPVIVSDRVGCSAEIVEVDKNGLIFQLGEKDALHKAILKMINPVYYNFLRQNVCCMDFKTIVERQVNCYLGSMNKIF